MATQMRREQPAGEGPRSVAWIRDVPKVELHLHLEGAIPLDTLWQLIAKYGGDSRASSRAALDEVFRYRDFPEFIQTWLWKHSFLREPDDLALIAAGVGQELARQHVAYVEAFYSPFDLRSTGMSPQVVTDALRRGLDSVAGVEVALVADLVRDSGPDAAARTLEEVSEVRALGVIGVGIGGSEHAFPPAQFAAVFERARALGFRTTAHAGEAAGPDSVWSAIHDLRVERIGHGTRSVEDPSLVRFLARERLPLEMCPSSNVATGVVPSIAAHPIRQLFDAGVLVTVNSDDPGMFGNSLAGEYEALERDLAFTADEMRTLLVNAVEASWLDDERKRALRSRLETGIENANAPV